VLHFAGSGGEALELLADENRGHAARRALRHQYARDGRSEMLGEIKQRFPDLPVTLGSI
jgi:hypothetical protein